MYSYCYVHVFLLLSMFRSGYTVLLSCSVYCLCVNVYCTTATGCQLNCNQQIYNIISYQSICLSFITLHAKDQRIIPKLIDNPIVSPGTPTLCHASSANWRPQNQGCLRQLMYYLKYDKIGLHPSDSQVLILQPYVTVKQPVFRQELQTVRHYRRNNCSHYTSVHPQVRHCQITRGLGVKINK
jgi:hypothetical protein